MFQPADGAVLPDDPEFELRAGPRARVVAVAVKPLPVLGGYQAREQAGIGVKCLRLVTGDPLARGRGVDETSLRVKPEFPVEGVIRDDAVLLL